jgi:hypothetical protein
MRQQASPSQRPARRAAKVGAVGTVAACQNAHGISEARAQRAGKLQTPKAAVSFIGEFK